MTLAARLAMAEKSIANAHDLEALKEQCALLAEMVAEVLVMLARHRAAEGIHNA